MYDANAVLQSAVTKTETFNGDGYSIPTGTPRRGLVARFIASAYNGTAPGNTITFSIDHSDDDTTYHTLVSGVPLTAGTAAQSAVQHLTFETQKPYVRASATVGGAASLEPTVAYKCDIGVAKP